jgi:hypothetical protein
MKKPKPPMKIYTIRLPLWAHELAVKLGSGVVRKIIERALKRRVKR